MELQLRPVEEVERVEKPLRAKHRKMAGEIVQLLANLDEYDAPDTPAEQYVDGRSGKYVVALEAIYDAAAKTGMFDLARVTLVDLLRMTKLGRAKADINLGTKLRDENILKHLSDEELKSLVSQPTGN